MRSSIAMAWSSGAAGAEFNDLWCADFKGEFKLGMLFTVIEWHEGQESCRSDDRLALSAHERRGENGPQGQRG
jgi:hypothetical protein